MSTPSLPPWENVQLSSILAMTARNEQANARRLPEFFAVLERLNGAFSSALAAASTCTDAPRVMPSILLAKAYSDFLAATRLALSGQVAQAFMPTRGMIESSWY